MLKTAMSFERGNELRGFITGRELLEFARNYRRLRKVFAVWNE
jgi:hypothetical protein